MYQVPYSEHSSFSELQQFVAFMRPHGLVPSVGNDYGPKAAQMRADCCASSWKEDSR